MLALVVNTYLLDGVPQLGAAINGIARKTLTITMFFIGASLSIDVLKHYKDENGNEIALADSKKLALMGALSLYITFINLFLSLLRVFGDRR